MHEDRAANQRPLAVRLKDAIARDYKRGRFVAIAGGQIVADADGFDELPRSRRRRQRLGRGPGRSGGRGLSGKPPLFSPRVKHDDGRLFRTEKPLQGISGAPLDSAAPEGAGWFHRGTGVACRYGKSLRRHSQSARHGPAEGPRRARPAHQLRVAPRGMAAARHARAWADAGHPGIRQRCSRRGRRSQSSSISGD